MRIPVATAALRFAVRLVVIATLLVASQAVAAADAPERLPRALARALDVRAFAGANVSALVVERASGREVFARNPSQPRTPASTQKLLTSIVALDVFGPGHRFETVLLADAPADESGAVDALYVRGGGDASLTAEQWWRLAADLRAAGITKIRGDLWLDDQFFDAARWHPDWQPLTARAYHAPVGALSANYGAFRVIVAPGAKAGQPAQVRVDPPLSYFRLSGEAITRARAGPSLRVERRAGDGFERVVVSGSVRLGREPEEVWRSVADPLGYAGAVLQRQLAANGIALAGVARAGRAPEGGHEVLRFQGHPLHRNVSLLLKYSNNMMAESLLKALAAQRGVVGNWPDGVAALAGGLRALGVPLDGARIKDGSGLSRANRVSARTLVEALRIADRRFAFGPDLLAALPIAAVDGTLRERSVAARARVRAKTGSLKGITALAGYAQHHDGRAFVFALLVDGHQSSDRAAMDAVDHFVAALVGADG